MLPPDFNPDDPTEVTGGRRFPWHAAGDWLFLAVDPGTGKPLKPGAKALYSTLCMHKNRERGDDLVWPGTDALAELLGLSRGDKVTPYLQALQRVGAVDVEVVRWGQNNMKRRNLYTVHEAPPEGYTGFSSLKEFYAARRSHREEMEETAAHLGKNAGQPGPPEKGGTGCGQSSGDDAPVPPKTGGPDTPDSGAPEDPVSGAPIPPETGDQPHEQLNHTNSEHQAEEEAARGRAEQGSAPIEPPSYFALTTLRQLVAEAPQTSGRGRELAEVIGETEIHDLARAFDAEAARLSEHVPAGAGGDLAAWLGRGLGTANSLYAVLRSRLAPGYATGRIIRPAKHARRAPADAPPRDEKPAACTVHPGATPGACAACAAADEQARKELEASARRGAALARGALGASRAG